MRGKRGLLSEFYYRMLLSTSATIFTLLATSTLFAISTLFVISTLFAISTLSWRGPPYATAVNLAAASDVPQFSKIF